MNLESIISNESRNEYNRYQAAKKASNARIRGVLIPARRFIEQARTWAFRDYKGKGYKGIREYMYGRSTNKYNRSAAEIFKNTFEDPLTKRGPPSGVQYLYRGLGDMPLTARKGYLENKSFSSWTSDKHKTALFASGGKYGSGVVLKLNTQKMKNVPYVNYGKGKPPAFLNRDNKEKEYILPPKVFLIDKPRRVDRYNVEIDVTNLSNQIPLKSRYIEAWKKRKAPMAKAHSTVPVTVAQLRLKAMKAGIKIPSGYRKDQIVALLSNVV